MQNYTDPYNADQPALPAWDDPKPGEPAHGFVVRLAEINRRYSVRKMLIRHGLNGVHMQPDECLSFALSLPFRKRDELVHATPVLSPERVVLMGQTLRRRHFQLEHRRFCAACIAEDPYHRAVWDLVDFRCCPYQDIEIDHRDSNGRIVPWWFPSLSRSPAGLDLARYGIPRRAKPRPSLEAYILGKLELEEAVQLPLLDGLESMGDALDAVRFLGRIAIWGKRETRPAYDQDGSTRRAEVMKAGFELANRGEAGVVEFLHEVADANTAAVPGTTKTSCFGWIADELWNQEKGSPVQLIEGLLDRIVVQRNRSIASARGFKSEDKEGWLPLPDLAQELGLPVDSLRAISQSLGIHVKPQKHALNRFLAFFVHEADLVRRTLATLVGRDEAAAILNVTRSCLDALVNAGLLCPLTGTRGNRGGDKFAVDDVQSFSRRLLSKSVVVENVDDGWVRLGSLKRTKHLDPSKLVVDILEDQTKTFRRVGSSAGDLLLEKRVRRLSPRSIAGNSLAHPGVSRFVAASLIGCQVHAIDAILEAGLLDPLPICDKADIARGRRRIDPHSIDAFRRLWAYAEIYRAVLGLKPADRRSGPMLEDLGVKVHRLTIRDRDCVVYLVERASARKILGLKHDPDAPESGSATAFETMLIAALAERGTFKRGGQTGSVGLISMSSDMSLSIDIRHGQDAAVLKLLRYKPASRTLDEQVEFARKASVRRFPIEMVDGRIAAELDIALPGLGDPSTWPALVKELVAATELFRTCFPLLRYARRKTALV